VIAKLEVLSVLGIALAPRHGLDWKIALKLFLSNSTMKNYPPKHIQTCVSWGLPPAFLGGVDEDFHKLMDSFKWDQPLAPLHILNMK